MTSIYMIISAANTLAGWRARKVAKGFDITSVDMEREAHARWPELSEADLDEIVAASDKPRGMR